MDAEALNKCAEIVVLFRAFVIEERAPSKTGTVRRRQAEVEEKMPMVCVI